MHKNFCNGNIFLYVVLKTYKLELIALLTFIYIGVNIYADPFNDSKIFMYFLALLSLHVRGIMNNHKTIKYLLFIFLSNLRFVINVFL